MNRPFKQGVLTNKSQQGSMAIFFVLMLPVLLASMGLALDVGKFYVVRSELQNAADACALAAAFELNGTATQFARANTAGLNLAAQNRVYFQNGAVAGTTVQFSTTANGGFANAAPANASFVRCNVNQPNVPIWFNQVVPIGNPTIRATAVASNIPAQSSCALPIGLCSVSVTTPPGTWLPGVQSASNGVTGFFRWIDFDPPAGGAQDLAEILSGPNTCNINTNNPNLPLGQFGTVASPRVHYNTRFGVRAPGQPALAASVPDISGFSYYPSNFPAQFNAFQDFVNNRRTINAPYQNNIPEISLSANTTILNANQLRSLGANRRVAVAPVINCATQQLERYACVFLLHPMNAVGNANFNMFIEYLGDARNALPCRGFGLAGPSNSNGPRVSALVQ